MPSLLEALEQKYGESPSDPDASDDVQVAIFVPCKSPRAVVPALLVLNDCDIATAGEKEALEAKCAGVEELDLAKNKLSHWPEVFSILEKMPRLKFVNLSFNVLSKPIQEIEINKQMKWQELRSLVLNNTYINWDSVSEILDHLPCLEELHLSLNDYNDVYLHKDTINCECNEKENDNICEKCNCHDYKLKHKHSVIRILHFTGNPVENWSAVAKLGYAFPKLQTLVLAECPIRSLDVNEDCQTNCNKNYDKNEEKYQAPHDAFLNLKMLNLNSSQISTWDDIDKLAKFPSLKCLRVQGWPLWETNEYTEHERRQLLIARLPNVETLNGGGKISPDERESAERAFIRYYMDKPESDRPERYFELVQIHGKLDPLVHIDLRPEKRVKVTFTCGSNSEVRSLDVYRTVNDLKVKLEGFAGFSAAKMRLFYVDQEFRDIQGPEEMRYPMKQLYSYNIRSGDEIIIDCKKRLNSDRDSKITEDEEKEMYDLK